MKNISKSKGLNLIELLVVVTIIGLLFAFAFVNYQRYLIRSQVSRVLLETSNLRTVVENCINNGNLVIGKASEDKCDTNATPSSVVEGDSQGDRADIAGMGVAQAEIKSDGSATIISTFGNSAFAVLKVPPAAFIRWSRTTQGVWTCESTAEAKYNDPACL